MGTAKIAKHRYPVYDDCMVPPPLQALEERIPTEQDSINQLEECTNKAVDSTAAPGKPKLKDQFTSAKERWEAFHKQAADLESKLQNSLKNWEDHDSKIGDFLRWLEKAEESLDGLMELQPDVETKQQLCDDCKVSKPDV